MNDKLKNMKLLAFESSETRKQFWLDVCLRAISPQTASRLALAPGRGWAGLVVSGCMGSPSAAAPTPHIGLRTL